MGLFDRKPVAVKPPARPFLGTPRIGDPVGVFLSAWHEPLVTGHLIASLPTADGLFICDVNHNDAGPWFASYRADQIEKIDGEPIDTDQIITMTDDGLTPGARVFIHIRERNTTGRGHFVCEFMGHRCVVFERGGPAYFPAQDVEPISRAVTAEQVMKMRDATGMGMMQCRTILEGQALRQDVNMAETIADLRTIVGKLVDKVYPEDHHTLRALELLAKSG